MKTTRTRNKIPQPQYRKSLVFGSGEAGKARYGKYLEAADKANKEIQEWFRDTLDREASRLLNKSA